MYCVLCIVNCVLCIVLVVLQGIPWIANWMWQRFENFLPDTPPEQVWVIPPSCSAAEACPGW